MGVVVILVILSLSSSQVFGQCPPTEPGCGGTINDAGTIYAADPVQTITQPSADPVQNITQPARDPVQNITQPAAGGVTTLSNPLSGGGVNSIGELVRKASTIFAFIVVLFAVLALVWTGLQFIMAQGKPEELKTLKNRLLWIVIGVAIVIGARIIVEVVINTLQVSGVVNQQVINSARTSLSGQ